MVTAPTLLPIVHPGTENQSDQTQESDDSGNDVLGARLTILVGTQESDDSGNDASSRDGLIQMLYNVYPPTVMIPIRLSPTTGPGNLDTVDVTLVVVMR